MFSSQHSETCPSRSKSVVALTGEEILRTEKFDAVIVDCDDLAGGLRVLEGLRKAPSNRNSVTFAILSGTSAALNFMTREQRRYFRHPVEIAATLESGEGQRLKATITNISEGGMAIFFRGKFPSGRVSANFKLPGGGSPLEPKVQVAWMDDSGRTGLRFFDLPKDLRGQLDQWLAAQCEKAENGARD